MEHSTEAWQRYAGGEPMVPKQAWSYWDVRIATCVVLIAAATQGVAPMSLDERDDESGKQVCAKTYLGKNMSQ